MHNGKNARCIKLRALNGNFDHFELTFHSIHEKRACLSLPEENHEKRTRLIFTKVKGKDKFIHEVFHGENYQNVP